MPRKDGRPAARAQRPPHHDPRTQRALRIAGGLIDAGVPVFVAQRREDGSFVHPRGWENTKPDRALLDRYQDGDALCAVMGVVVDGLDADVQHGGDITAANLDTAGHLPRSYGRQRTPSGGTHDLIAPLHVGSRDGFAEGVDLKGGRPDGEGRGILYIAPTQKVSKTTGEVMSYEWEVEPDLTPLLNGEPDDSGAMLAEMVRTSLGATSPRLSQDLPVGGVRLGGANIAGLLADPPERGAGQTNDWLTKVAGHYAHQYRDRRDLYELHVRQAADKVDPDYEDTDKILESIWGSEQAKPVPADERQQRIAERVEAKLIEHEAKAQFARVLAELDPADPFDAGSLAEILARPDSTRFRVEGLLLAEGFTTVVAARKTGKTTFNLNLADSLLTGRDFLGRFPVEPVAGRIALLNFEVAARQVAHWASLVGVDPDRFDIVTLRGRRNPLLHPQDRADLAKYLRDRDVEFLFVDPLSRAFYGDNGNDNTQMQRFLSDLDTFARSEVGATDVVLNVHAGWNADRSRGASATEDHPDSIIWLRPGDREKGDRSTYVEARGRDVDVDEMQLAFDPSTYRLSLTGEGSRREAKRTQKQGDLEPHLQRIITGQPGINTKGLTEALRAAQVPFQKGDETRTLKAMHEGGRIGWKRGASNASLWYPPGHPEAATKSPLAGMNEDDF